MRREQLYTYDNPAPWYIPSAVKIRGLDATMCDYCGNIWITRVKDLGIFKHHLRCPDRDMEQTALIPFRFRGVTED